MLAKMVKRLAAIGVVACFFAPVSACKEKAPPTGVVIALDSAGTAISGATVKLTSRGDRGDGILKATGTTDGSGKAHFDEFTLPAILNVTCSKVKAVGDTLKGTGILKLEEDKETEATITLK